MTPLNFLESPTATELCHRSYGCSVGVYGFSYFIKQTVSDITNSSLTILKINRN